MFTNKSYNHFSEAEQYQILVLFKQRKKLLELTQTA